VEAAWRSLDQESQGVIYSDLVREGFAMGNVFPLVAGGEARADRLRGYGNAIVPQVAALFIRAFMEEFPA